MRDTHWVVSLHSWQSSSRRKACSYIHTDQHRCCHASHRKQTNPALVRQSERLFSSKPERLKNEYNKIFKFRFILNTAIVTGREIYACISFTDTSKYHTSKSLIMGGERERRKSLNLICFFPRQRRIIYRNSAYLSISLMNVPLWNRELSSDLHWHPLRFKWWNRWGYLEVLMSKRRWVSTQEPARHWCLRKKSQPCKYYLEHCTYIKGKVIQMKTITMQ